MCGRFILTSNSDELVGLFELDIKPPRLQPNYNIAPTSLVPVVRHLETKGRYCNEMKWGLVPAWAKDPAIGNRMINARSETVAEKPAFRSAFKKRRCLVPTNGFYEWKKTEDGKQPYWIGLPDKQLFAFAGLCEIWRSKQGAEELETFTIITTQASPELSSLHERMPVMIKPEMYNRWLDPETKASQLEELLVPYDDQIDYYPVSTAVNSPRNNTADLINAIE